MRISDPNKLVGKIIKIKTGEDMTEIIVDVGDQAVTATITSGAAGDMNLNEGDEIFAVFNSTSVSLIKDSKDSRRDYEI
ncbi:MAG TPA: TOBE domain-containing protein [Syntrophomonas sp.]|nr:TOBE domain-containing protein [Syntrophomonas sp.]